MFNLTYHGFYVIRYLFLYSPCPSEFYTLSLHDALPICLEVGGEAVAVEASSPVELGLPPSEFGCAVGASGGDLDRKSTRLNSSHRCISYSVLCLEKKKVIENTVFKFCDILTLVVKQSVS